MVGRQPWCNGQIGTAGGSYVGWTQWAPAASGSRHLKAMVQVVPFDNAYDIAYSGGAFQLALLMGWGAAVGPYDQTKVEEREDVLVYSTAPLEQDLEVTGPVKMVLYAASSAPDTDFTAKLVDVHPDGKAYNLCDGIVRARYRNGMDKPALLEPDKPERFEIDLWVTSNLFKRGHRIRLEVSSSNFPRFDRNPNSGKPFGPDTELLSARQTVFHDAARPSHLLLPVIPR